MGDNIQTTVQGYGVRTQGAAFVPRSIQAVQGLAQWKAEGMDDANFWLRQEIGMAMQQMVCLRLANTPAVEMLPYTAEMWLQTVGDGMIKEIDRPRIRKAFQYLYRTLKWWPQPAELLAALPTRPVRMKLPERELSDEEHADQAAKLREILDGLGKPVNSEPGEAI
jgi:hypothetical protein